MNCLDELLVFMTCRNYQKKNLNKVANNLSEEIIGKSVLDLILMFKNYAKKCQGQKIFCHPCLYCCFTFWT